MQRTCSAVCISEDILSRGWKRRWNPEKTTVWLNGSSCKSVAALWRSVHSLQLTPRCAVYQQCHKSTCAIVYIFEFQNRIILVFGLFFQKVGVAKGKREEKNVFVETTLNGKDSFAVLSFFSVRIYWTAKILTVFCRWRLRASYRIS